MGGGDQGTESRPSVVNKRTVQAKDLPDDLVLAMVQLRIKVVRSEGYAEPMVELLARAAKIPTKLAYYKLSRLAQRGLIDCGTSVNNCWPTRAGLDVLKLTDVADLS